MPQREASQPLSGDVRIDDGYWGVNERAVKRGADRKITAFVAAVEMRDGRPQRVRFDPVAGFSFQALKPWAASALLPGSHITSDGLLGFEGVRQLGFVHHVVLAPKGKAGNQIDAFKWLNILMGNLKTALSRTYHAFKFSKYAARYLADVVWRFGLRQLILMTENPFQIYARAYLVSYCQIRIIFQKTYTNP